MCPLYAQYIPSSTPINDIGLTIHDVMKTNSCSQPRVFFELGKNMVINGTKNKPPEFLSYIFDLILVKLLGCLFDGPSSN